LFLGDVSGEMKKMPWHVAAMDS
jgi:FkbM family methyltransferase